MDNQATTDFMRMFAFPVDEQVREILVRTIAALSHGGRQSQETGAGSETLIEGSVQRFGNEVRVRLATVFRHNGAILRSYSATYPAAYNSAQIAQKSADAFCGPEAHYFYRAGPVGHGPVDHGPVGHSGLQGRHSAGNT
jgi:hypothetical protein